MKTGTWLGRLFRPQIKVQTIDDVIKDLGRISNKLKSEEQCIWNKIMKREAKLYGSDGVYKCEECTGYKKECHGYVPLNFYKK